MCLEYETSYTSLILKAMLRCTVDTDCVKLPKVIHVYMHSELEQVITYGQ